MLSPILNGLISSNWSQPIFCHHFFFQQQLFWQSVRRTKLAERSCHNDKPSEGTRPRSSHFSFTSFFIRDLRAEMAFRELFDSTLSTDPNVRRLAELRLREVRSLGTSPSCRSHTN